METAKIKAAAKNNFKDLEVGVFIGFAWPLFYEMGKTGSKQNWTDRCHGKNHDPPKKTVKRRGRFPWLFSSSRLGPRPREQLRSFPSCRSSFRSPFPRQAG